ncbi:MAG: 30S ribosomal protein S9 [Ignavibacteria bacterium]|nr:30S ribosomal protein S9 [Ignavibacteria bacterium]
MTTISNVSVGRRKTATARIYLLQGDGKFIINKKEAKDYLKSDARVDDALQPLKVTENLGNFDVKVNVSGGGIAGQVGAIKLGIARALVSKNEELRSVLRTNGFLTRDPRMVERKKYGQPKARKRFQFSKR